MVQHSRKPAAVVLAITLAAAFSFAWFTAGGVDAADDVGLLELQRAITDPDAPPVVWQQYAQKLQQLKQYRHAADAWRRYLRSEPYNREARLQACLSLALAGDPQEYLAFLKEVVLADPKLAVEVLERPESSRYLSDPQFPALLNEARIQSMD